MYSKKFSIGQHGQTLLELVVVLSVSVMIIGALVFVTIASLRNAQFSKNQVQATKLAQEGIERVRAGRDRNECISNLDSNSVHSWNGLSSNTNCPGSGTIWDFHISGRCEIEQPQVSTKCYFNIDANGSLTNIGFSQAAFPESLAEGIPTNTPVFRRVIILSDDLNDDKNFTNDNYMSAKKVTSVVRWKDFSGEHFSQLTTILRNQTQ